MIFLIKNTNFLEHQRNIWSNEFTTMVYFFDSNNLFSQRRARIFQKIKQTINLEEKWEKVRNMFFCSFTKDP